ncbi:MAG: hypothetical protein ABW006_00475 [Hyphomicrobium sp.]
MSVIRALYRFSSFKDPDDGHNGAGDPPPDLSRAREFPYRVELWDSAKKTVEQILAITASGGIGFAAYHAATKEYPDRYILLRHHDAILSRWNGPPH